MHRRSVISKKAEVILFSPKRLINSILSHTHLSKFNAKILQYFAYKLNHTLKATRNKQMSEIGIFSRLSQSEQIEPLVHNNTKKTHSVMDIELRSEVLSRNMARSNTGTEE